MKKKIIIPIILIILLTGIQLTYADITTATQNVESCYNFDSGINESANQRNMTIRGTPTFSTTAKIGNGSVTGFSDTSYLYRGDEDWQDYGFLPAHGGSLGVWVQGTTLTNPYKAVAKGNGSGPNNFYIYATGPNTIEGLYQGSGATIWDTSGQSTGIWYYYLFNHYSNGTTCLWVDNTIKECENPNIPGNSNTNNMTIGKVIGSGEAAGRYWRGYIDELTIWNTTLNSTQRSDLYNSGNGRNCSYILSGAVAGPTPATSGDIYLYDIYDNTTLQGRNITIYNATWENSTLTTAAGLARFPTAGKTYNWKATGTNILRKDGTENLTDGKTIAGQAYTAAIRVYNYSTIEGNTLIDHKTACTPQKCYNLTTDKTIALKAGYDTQVEYARNNWYNRTITYNESPGTNRSSIPTNFANTWWKFKGDTTGIVYTPQCLYNETILTRSNNYYEILQTGNISINCTETQSYAALNFITNTTRPQNTTHTLEEFKITLAFLTNVTGYFKWLSPDGTVKGQHPLNTTGGYNYSTFEFIRILSTWPDETIVEVIYNQKIGSNLTAQYYEFKTEAGTIHTDNLREISNLDTALWVAVTNYGGEGISEATIRLEYCPDDNSSNCRVVQNRLTRQEGGEAVPGRVIYFDPDLDYWLTVSKEGYETKRIMLHGYDYDNNKQLIIQLKILDTSLGNWENTYNIYGPNYHSNESTLMYLLTRPNGGNYYWNTTYKTKIEEEGFTNGGSYLLLDVGTDYEASTNFTTYIYSYNGTTEIYTLEQTFTTYYEKKTEKNILAGITNNTTLSILTWILLILLASIIGATLLQDGVNDTGMYIFITGTVLLSFILPTFYIPIAASASILMITKIVIDAKGE